MPFLTATTEGFADLPERLARATEDVSARVLLQVHETAETILTESKRVVPVDTSKLQGTGFVEHLPDGANVGYDTDYALAVHENPNAYHKPPTHYQFLAGPALAYWALFEREADRVLHEAGY